MSSRKIAAWHLFAVSADTTNPCLDVLTKTAIGCSAKAGQRPRSLKGSSDPGKQAAETSSAELNTRAIPKTALSRKCTGFLSLRILTHTHFDDSLPSNSEGTQYTEGIQAPTREVEDDNVSSPSACCQASAKACQHKKNTKLLTLNHTFPHPHVALSRSALTPVKNTCLTWAAADFGTIRTHELNPKPQTVFSCPLETHLAVPETNVAPSGTWLR